MPTDDSLDQLLNIRNRLLETVDSTEAYRESLDKLDSRSWKMHVIDPLSDVSRFVTNKIGEKENPRPFSLGTVATLDKYKDNSDS